MARGSYSKDIVTKKILSTFPGAFEANKKIYIPMKEDGTQIQLCLSLTAPKVPVQAPLAQESADFDWSADTPVNSASTEPAPVVHVEISQEEQDNIKKMLENLGL